MKTLTISEAAKDLAAWIKKAIAGEEIVIHTDGSDVALRPLSTGPLASGKPSSPLEALRCLQQDSRLTGPQADAYLREVQAERRTA